MTEYIETKDAIYVLERNPPGMGETQIELEARTEDERYSVNVQIHDRTYDEKELKEVFKQGKAWLDKVWLGENTSNDKVCQNLYFPTEIEDMDLRVRWETGNSQWIQSNGIITKEGFDAAPQKIEIYATLVYGSYEERYTYIITIIPPESTKEEEFEKLLNKSLDLSEKNSLSDEQMMLPTEVNGTTVVWYRQKNGIGIKTFLFGMILLVLLYFTNEEKKTQKIKERKQAMNQDYPDIVYRLVILISAGMTVKHAWEKVLEVYEREKEQTGYNRWGYEEMEITYREMNHGISEIKAYENFGKRCESPNYMRLSELLVQQVRRGARGMNQLLMREVMESEIMWRENSRKKAEEAGTKLLMPMILLMTVVFAVLMIPAFLSMSL